MKNQKTLVISAIAFLMICLGVVSYLFIQKSAENKDMVALFDIEKEEMENEYSSFASQYDELQIQINNDSLQAKLESEKIKTQRLLEELRQVKSTNATEIARLRKELNTVRAVLRTYIIQIDSLNQLNQALASENKEVKARYNEAARKISNLAVEKETLNKKVNLAAQLDATGIYIAARNKKGKTAKKVKDVTKFVINFTVVKNITATTGERTLYIRIAKPNNDILSKNSSNTFEYENKQLSYSIRKHIEYTGEEQDVTVYWDVEEFLNAGTYQVYIFADGTMIGSQSFNLE